MVAPLTLAWMQSAVGDIAAAVDGETDVDAWVTKAVLLACLGAMSYMGKMLLERPRASEVDDAKAEIRALKARVEQLTDERAALRIEVLEAKMQSRNGGGAQ